MVMPVNTREHTGLHIQYFNFYFYKLDVWRYSNSDTSSLLIFQQITEDAHVRSSRSRMAHNAV